jgi:hypothetical protein
MALEGVASPATADQAKSVTMPLALSTTTSGAAFTPFNVSVTDLQEPDKPTPEARPMIYSGLVVPKGQFKLP